MTTFWLVGLESTDSMGFCITRDVVELDGDWDAEAAELVLLGTFPPHEGATDHSIEIHGHRPLTAAEYRRYQAIKVEAKEAAARLVRNLE